MNVFDIGGIIKKKILVSTEYTCNIVDLLLICIYL